MSSIESGPTRLPGSFGKVPSGGALATCSSLSTTVPVQRSQLPNSASYPTPPPSADEDSSSSPDHPLPQSRDDKTEASQTHCKTAGNNMNPSGIGFQVFVRGEQTKSGETWVDAIRRFFSGAEGDSPDSLTTENFSLGSGPGKPIIGAFNHADYDDIFTKTRTFPEYTGVTQAQSRRGDDTGDTVDTAAVNPTKFNARPSDTQDGCERNLPDDDHTRTAGTQHESTQRDTCLSPFSLRGCTANTLQSAFTFLLHPVATTQKWAAAPLQPAMKAWDGWVKASEPFRTAAVGGAVSLLGLAVLRTAVNTATDVKRCVDAWSRPIGSSVG